MLICKWTVIILSYNTYAFITSHEDLEIADSISNMFLLFLNVLHATWAFINSYKLFQLRKNFAHVLSEAISRPKSFMAHCL